MRDWIERMGVFAKVVAKRSFFGAAQEPHGAPGPTQGRIAEMVTPTIASFGTVGMSPLGTFHSGHQEDAVPLG